ncbi:MAG TPA: redox-sensing transcriptional repressor Rex, partial [Gemmatimonadaceae bacterium]|nr:redox-sensing transcriptional repressor Rex [Gemmatimonadaceae bacterium]
RRPVKHIAESTVRRLSLYLRILEEFEAQAHQTISSGELAAHGGTTSAQVRKDLSFFGSFGKRGLGYSVTALAARLREILGLNRQWRVIILGAGKIGAALARYEGFRNRGFTVVGVYDADPARTGRALDNLIVRDQKELEADVAKLGPEIALIAVPAEAAQPLVDRVVKAGVRAILNFAPAPVHVPRHVVHRSVDMALELEILSYALVSRR